VRAFFGWISNVFGLASTFQNGNDNTAVHLTIFRRIVRYFRAGFAKTFDLHAVAVDAA